jgi:hypothetical protein
LKKFFIEGFFMVLIALAAALFLVEWMAGCGETYIAADGQRYAHECVFLK